MKFNKMFLRKKPAIKSVAIDAEETLNPKDLNGLESKAITDNLDNKISMSKVLKPFYRITKNGSYTTFDIYPKFKLCKRKAVIEEFYYADEEELAAYINAKYREEEK